MTEQLQSVAANAAAISGEIRAAAGLEAQPESRAKTELDAEAAFVGEWGKTPVLDALTVADARLAAAARGLEGMALLLQQELQAFSVAILARSVIEASARAWWALDPGIDVRGRVLRVMIDRLVLAREQRAIRRAISPETLSGKGTELESRITRTAAALLIPLRETDRGPELDGVGRPGNTAVVGLQLRPEIGDVAALGYSHLAAIAHGDYTALIERQERVAEIGALTYMKPSFRGAAVDVSVAVWSYYLAFDREASVMGWDVFRWRAFWREALRVLRPLMASAEETPRGK